MPFYANKLITKAFKLKNIQPLEDQASRAIHFPFRFN